MEKRNGLLLTSGGPDSTVLAYMLKQNNIDISALVIKTDEEVGKFEEKKASYFMNKLNIKLETLDIIQAATSIIYPTTQPIPITENFIPINPFRGIPGEVPHFKNHHLAGEFGGTLFGLSIAIAYALQKGIDTIYYGIQGDDKDQFNENNREYFETLSKLVEIETGKNFKILTPLIEFSKSEVIKLGDTLGVELSKTHSCADKIESHCGTCGSCKARKKAFIDNG